MPIRLGTKALGGMWLGADTPVRALAGAILPGETSISPSVPGVTLTSFASLVAGAPSIIQHGSAPGETLSAIASFVPGAPTTVVNYYVNAVNGSDSNDGESEETAWQTLAKVNAATFNPGDQVLFRGGDTFSGHLVLRDGQHYGAPGSPVVFGSYGTGKATIQTANNAHDGIDALNPHDVTIQDLIVLGTGNTVSTARGVYARNDLLDGSKLPGVSLLGLEVSGHGVDGIAFLTGDTAYAAEAPSGFASPIIDGCVVHDCTGNTTLGYGMGIAVRGLWGLNLYDPSTTDVLVQNCVVYNCTGKSGLGHHSGNGIFVGEGIDGGLIQYCLAYNNGQNGNGSVGIWTADAFGVIIQFCVSRDNKTTLGASDGGGFDIDGGAQDCIIQYCYSKGNAGSGFQMYQYSGSTTELLPLSGNIIRYCISENDGAQNPTAKGAISIGCEEARDQPGNFIYGCTVYQAVANGNGLNFFTAGQNARFVNGGFFNNILVVTNGKLINSMGTAVPATSFLVQGNLYWPDGTAVSIKWGSTTYSSIAAWRAATSRETDTGVDTSTEADPMFAGALPVGAVDSVADAALAAYQTLSGSPTQSRGQDIFALVGVTPPRDFFGNVVPQNGYDIGAFESDGIGGLDATYWQFDEPADASGDPNTVSQLWSGVATEDTFAWSAKLSATAANVRLVISTASDLSSPKYSKNPVASANGHAKSIVQGLVADTTYYWGLLVDGVLQDTLIGKFKTLPSSAAFSYRFAVGSCNFGADGTSFAGMAALDPLFALQTGDIHYQDPNTVAIADHLAAMDFAFTPSQAADFYRTTPTAHVWSDHDYCGDDDEDATGKTAAQAAFRAKVPHPALPVADGIYHSFKVGRVVYVMLDTHSFRTDTAAVDNSSKTVIGATQKTWLKNLLVDAANDGCVFAIVSPEPWNGTDPDAWTNYSTEQTELVDYIYANGLQNRIVMLCGDAHCVALDSGNNSPGALPVFQAAAWDTWAGGLSTKGVIADIGPFTTSLQQYGVVDVTDEGGEVIAFRFRGFTGAGGLLLDKTYYFAPDAPAIVNVSFQTDPALGSYDSQTIAVDATAGNRLLLLAAVDKNSGAINLPTDDGTGAWELVGTKHEAGTGISGALFTKVAAGDETTITVSWANLQRVTLALVEVAGAGAPDQFGISTTQASSAARTTGLISADGGTADRPQLALAFMFADSAASTDAATSYGWSNDYVKVAAFEFGEALSGGTGAPPVAVARKLLPTQQITSTEGTWTGDTVDEAMGLLVTLPMVGGGETAPLAIDGTPVTNTIVNAAYAGFTVTATGGVAPYTYALVGTWPAGISVDPSTGVVSGTPTQEGTFAGLSVQVTDANLDTAQLATFSLVVGSAQVNLMDGKSWVQYQCDIALQGNDVKFIKNQTASPRGAKLLTDLSPGATYRCLGNVRRGTIPDGNGIWFRVTTDQPMTSNKLLELTVSSGSIAVDHTFVATQTTAYVGAVGLSSVNGQYVVIDNDFHVEYVSG